MKKRLTKLNELQASLLIAGLIAIVLLLGASIGLFFSLPGLLIGAAIGTAVEFFYIWLVSVGATLTLKQEKTGLFFLTYIARIVVFVGLFALLVILQYRLHVDVFNYSCWAMLVAFVPATFITIAVQLMHKEEKNG
ncbi:MAG: hypothetical protein IKP50_06075 [Bacilli bacterium]|nr:hypothetical protein [Bacilli bacterium]